MHAEPRRWQHGRHEMLPILRLSSALLKHARQRDRCRQEVTAHGLRDAAAADRSQVPQLVKPTRGPAMPTELELAAEGCPRHQPALALGAAPGQRVTNRPAEGTRE